MFIIFIGFGIRIFKNNSIARKYLTHALAENNWIYCPGV